MNKNLKSIIVLFTICLVVSTLLACVNKITGPLIEEYNQEQAMEAYYEVMPNAKGFEEVSKSGYTNIPQEITKIYKETSGMGYVFEISTKGYANGFVVVCGISKEGKITNAKVLQSNETPSLGGKVENPSYINQYIGTDSTFNSVGEGWKISGATVTSGAFKNSLSKAFTAFSVLGGTYVPPKPVDHKLQAMPNATEFETIDLSVFENLSDSIQTVYKETTGLGYVIELTSWGYSADTPMTIFCGIDMEGKITGVVLGPNEETEGIGTQVGDKSYTNQYVGKDSNLEDITSISRATYSSEGFKFGIEEAFKAYAIINVKEGE